MGTAFRRPHTLDPLNGILKIQSHSPITRRCLGHSPNVLALFAKAPIPGGCGSGVGPIIVDSLSRWHRPPLARVRRTGNAEGKFDYVASEVRALKRAGR